MRDLRNTNNFPIVKHPAEQYKVTVNAKGDRIIFVSEDKDEDGDLRFLTLQPQRISKQYLRGISPPNLWDDSSKLSDAIRDWSRKNLPQECHGDFLETDPDLNAKGDQVLFISDRCNPGLHNIWLAKLEGEEVLELKQLTKLGASEPRFAPPPYENRIVFISYRDQKKGGRIYLLELSSKGSKIAMLPLPQGSENNFIYSKPDFLGKADKLVYSSIREDTNQDGILSSEDQAAIYSLSLKKGAFSFSAFQEKKNFETEKKLLEASAVLHGLSYSALLGGSIFYAASLYNSINIYFIPSKGLIPKEKNIEEQYQLSRRYLRQNEKRYFMAQQAVLDYHKNDPQYAYYEAQLLLDSVEYHRQKNDLRSLGQTEKKIKERLSKSDRNPYLSLYYGIYTRKQRDPQSVLPYLLNFQKKLSSSSQDTKAPDKSIDKTIDKSIRNSVKAFLKHKLAEEYRRLGRLPQALAEIKNLNANYPNYPFRKAALFFQAEVEHNLNPDIFPLILNQMAQEIKTEINTGSQANTKERARPEDLESIHKQIYELYEKSPTFKQTDKKIQIEKGGAPLEALVQSTLQLLHARQYIREAKYKEALSLALQVQAKVPKHKSAFRYLPNKGWSGLYTNSWLIIEECYRSLGKQNAAFAALIEIAGSYNKDAQLRLESARFTEFIDHTNQQIESYLAIARSLAQRYRKYKQEKESKKGNEYLNFAAATFDLAKRAVGQKTQKKEYIELGGSQILELDKLCSRFSQTNIIFQRLSSKYARIYINFCEKNGQVLKQAMQPRLLAEEVYKAVDLFYAIAYSNARILNFFFFNIRRLGLLEEIYEESSIYFRRLEVDIVAEQSKQLIDILEQNVLLDLLLGDSDTYSSENFSEIERDYRLLFKQAVLAHDLSTLYAYAYMLIKKNISRESFYTSLQQRGQDFSPSFLQERKKEGLHELKNAESLLRYILNVDPQHTDAYLLLGWLLQSIDQGKKNIVRYRANIWERMIGESYDTERDKDFYEKIYETYFPGNYYEENVELYRQALQRMEGLPFPKGKLGHLHLNLANNYFILTNFKEAGKHYRKVLRAFDTQDEDRVSFESQRQEILFYFNFARTLVYEGLYEQAIVYLKRSYAVYEEKEYIPLKGDHNRLQFTLNSKARQSLAPDLLGQRFARFSDVETKLKATRARLALIAALTGLAHWQAGNSKEALSYYHKADYHLYQEKPELPDILSRSNLLNFLALAYQDIGQLEDADRYAAIAAREAQETGLGRDEERYQAKGYCGRGLGCFLNFGEDFSVVGEGRNPYGFAPLRQYELALSIQLENMIRRDEFGPAAKLIKKQRRIFSKHELDLKHGQIGYLNTLNKEALSNYKAGNYRKAAASFLKAAQKSHDFSNMESFRINYANHFNSLLSWLEYSSPSPRNALGQIEKALSNWTDFEELYREEIRKLFISEKRAEFYAYSFDEKRDGAFLEERIQEGLGYMSALKASFLYYKAHFSAQQNKHRSFTQEEKKQSIYKEAISILKGVLENIEDKESSVKAFTIACRYNLARLYFAKGQLYLARELLEESIQEAYEFHLFREEILLRLLANQVYEELYTIYQVPEDEERSFYHMEILLELFFSNPHRYESLHREANKITKSAASFYIKQGDERQALQILEQSWNLYLNWQYFRYRVAFKEEAPKKLHEGIAAKRRLLKALDERKYLLRLERKKTNELDKTGLKLKKEVNLMRASLRKLSPQHTAFLNLRNWKAKLKPPSLAKGQILMRFFAGSDSSPVLWCFSSRKEEGRSFLLYSQLSSQSSFYSKEAKKRSFRSNRSKASGFFSGLFGIKAKESYHYEESVGLLIEECLDRQTKGSGKINTAAKDISDIFLILTEELSSLDFYQIIKDLDPQLPAPIFAARLSESFLGQASSAQKLGEAQGLHLFNAGSISPILRPYLSSALQESKGKINGHTLAKLWKKESQNKITASVSPENIKKDSNKNVGTVLTNNPALALLLLKKTKERHTYKQAALLYEILRSYGVGTLAWEQEEDTIDLKELQGRAGQGRYTAKRLRIFGFAGFEGRTIPELLRKKYAALSLKAKQAEDKRQYQRARQLHLLAASYLSWHPNASQLSQDKALDLLRLEILLKPSASHNKTTAKLLSLARQKKKEREKVKEQKEDKQKEEKAKEEKQGEQEQEKDQEGFGKASFEKAGFEKASFEKAVYETAIYALSESNASEASLQYLQDYQKRFPDSQIQASEKGRVLAFISRLKQKRYVLGETKLKKTKLERTKREDFSTDFAKAYHYLKEQRDPQILEQLIKHSQYDAAEKLLAGWKENTKEKTFRDQLEDLELTILFARALLKGRALNTLDTIDLSLPILSPRALQKRSPYLQMLHAAWQGKWKEYAKFSKQVQNLFEKRKQDPRQHVYLYGQWKNFLKQQDLDLNYLNEIKQDKAEPFYVRFLERSLIYHLLTHSLELDSANQNALYLDAFIKAEEQEFSANPMAEKALYTAKKYIERGDLFHALHFFDLYLKAEENSIFVKQDTRLAARLGIILDSMGLRPNFIKYNKQWQENLEKASSQRKDSFNLGRFTLELFQGLSHGNLKNKIEHLNAHMLKFSEMEKAGAFQYPQKDRTSALLQDLEIALNLLQWQALRKEAWPSLLNLAFFKEELAYFNISRSKKLKSPVPLYQNYLAKLQKKIPLRQSFIGLLDTNNTALRFIFKKDDFHIFPLEQSAQFLRAKMSQYLGHRARRLRSYKEIERELSILYRSIPGSTAGSPGGGGNAAGGNLSKLSYLWLPGLHSLAPLYPKKGERLFQVLDIQSLLKYPPLAKAQKLKANFRVETIGERNLSSLHKKEENYLARRVYTMEKLAIKKLNIGKSRLSPNQEKQAAIVEEEDGFSKIYHIFSNLDNINRDLFSSDLIIEKPELRRTPWFVSSNFLEITAPKQIARHKYFLRNISRSFQAPGIMLLQKPLHLEHAYFVRRLYDESSPLRNIAERFANAYYLARQESPKGLDTFNYRLFTSRFLEN